MFRLGYFEVTGGLALDRVHNSRGPLDRLFVLCDPFGLIEIGWWDIVDYPCAKFGDFWRFGFYHAHTHTRARAHNTRMIAILTRVVPSAWVIAFIVLSVSVLQTARLFIRCEQWPVEHIPASLAQHALLEPDRHTFVNVRVYAPTIPMQTRVVST